MGTKRPEDTKRNILEFQHMIIPKIVRTEHSIISDDINDYEDETLFDGIKPEISFSRKTKIIRFNRTTITALYNPMKIAAVYNKMENVIAFLPCRTDYRDGIAVPDVREKWENFCINESAFLNFIWNKGGWQDNKSYRVIGEKIRGYKLVKFRLKEAEVINTVSEDDCKEHISGKADVLVSKT